MKLYKNITFGLLALTLGGVVASGSSCRVQQSKEPSFFTSLLRR